MTYGDEYEVTIHIPEVNAYHCKYVWALEPDQAKWAVEDQFFRQRYKQEVIQVRATGRRKTLWFATRHQS